MYSSTVKIPHLLQKIILKKVRKYCTHCTLLLFTHSKPLIILHFCAYSTFCYCDDFESSFRDFCRKTTHRLRCLGGLFCVWKIFERGRIGRFFQFSDADGTNPAPPLTPIYPVGRWVISPDQPRYYYPYSPMLLLLNKIMFLLHKQPPKQPKQPRI